MTRPTACTTPIVALALCSLLWLSSLAPALAATVTDTFPLKLTGTERCRNDPKFVEPIKVKVKDGVTLTLKRDVLNAGDLTDIQATINTHGDNATIDDMTLNGRALPANKSGSTAQLVLSGRDLGNPDRFMTLRGTATFNQAGKLTNVKGTYVYQVLSDSEGVPNSDCFGSGTFGAQKPSSSGGGGGTLTVANAPADLKGTFVAYPKATLVNTSGAVTWAELPTAVHAEAVSVSFDITTGQVLLVIFSKSNTTKGIAWSCHGFVPSGCAGASVDRTAGTFTVVDTVLDITTGTNSPITLDGTLHFTPF